MYLQIAIFLNNNENFFLHGRNNLLNTKVQFVLQRARHFSALRR